MSQHSVRPLSPEERQRMLGQMCLLMDRQVKSYHKHRHMGENSSVPAELARELMESIEYTAGLAGGLTAGRDLEAALKLGQDLLAEKQEKLKKCLELVTATGPAWQTECRWEALQALRRYLDAYDPLHLAHRGPEEVFYPVAISVPDFLRGIDLADFYLKVMWQENQIMASFSDTALERLWNKLPADALNQCEQMILNVLGKRILSADMDDLTFTDAQRLCLQARLAESSIRDRMTDAAVQLCGKLDLTKNAAGYFCAVTAQVLPRVETAVAYDSLWAVFL